MEEFKRDITSYVYRIQNARINLMGHNPFYASLLFDVKFALDDYAETAYTNGDMIAFCPDFMDEISDQELEFILMHEVLHIVLQHTFRRTDDKDITLYNIACDIVVNSNILYSFNMDKSKITLHKYGEAMHIAPDGNEGYLYTADEVYNMLPKDLDIDKRCVCQKENSDGETSKDNKNASMPGGRVKGKNKNPDHKDKNSEQSKFDKQSTDSFDDNTYWKNDDNPDDIEQWKANLLKAKKVKELMDHGLNGNGMSPLSPALERQIDEYLSPQTDWRTILDNFVQEDIVDYSFDPPDKRLQDFDCILPDFNEKEEKIKDIWFCVDTSGSIDDKDLLYLMSEIHGAITQFNGHLTASISFFDTNITKPIPFSSEEEFKEVIPRGGGGTSFDIIFDNINEFFKDELPSCIVVLTDGYADFPNQRAAQDVPVLWLITNKDITPPWGKIARIEL